MQAVFTTISSNLCVCVCVVYARSSALSNLRKTTEEDNENIVRSDGWIYNCIKEDIGVFLEQNVLVNCYERCPAHYDPAPWQNTRKLNERRFFSTRQLLFVEDRR